MAGVVNGLSTALEANQMEKVSMIMDQFESQTENLAVQSSYMESAMHNSTALTTPEDQVVSLMQQVADENGLDLKNQLGSLSPAASNLESASKEADDPLTERLARLRNA
jgi:charged multivesicular body protein 1